MNRIYHNVHQQARYCVSVTQVQHHNYHTRIRSMCRKMMLHRRSHTDTDTNTNTEPKYVEHTGTHKHTQTHMHSIHYFLSLTSQSKNLTASSTGPEIRISFNPPIHETQVIIAHHYNLLIFFLSRIVFFLYNKKNGSF